MFLAGCTSVAYDYRVLHPLVGWAVSLWKKRKQSTSEDQCIELQVAQSALPISEEETLTSAPNSSTATDPNSPLRVRNGQSSTLPVTQSVEAPEPRFIPAERTLNISWQVGTAILVAFFLVFAIIIRGLNSTILYDHTSAISSYYIVILGDGCTTVIS
jgi:hypothetical protein